MSYQKYLVEGVIVAMNEYGESGRVLRILTHDGIRGLVATGVRELKSKMRSEIDVLTKVEFEYVEGKEVGRLVGIFPKERLLNLRDPYVLSNILQIRNVVSNVTNFILRTVVGETPNEKLYESFLEGLRQVQQEQTPSASAAPQHLPSGKDVSATEQIEQIGKQIFKYNSKLVEVAKTNRKNMTKQEVIFWELVHKDKTGYDFTRQKPIGNFIIDFYCDELLLVIEIDGAFHSEIGYKERDEERSKYLESLGIKVIRFKNDEVVGRDFNVEYLKKIFQERNSEIVLLHSYPSLGKVSERSSDGRGFKGVDFQSLEIIWLIKILVSLGYWEEDLHDKFDAENMQYVLEHKKELIEKINNSIQSSHM